MLVMWLNMTQMIGEIVHVRAFVHYESIKYKGGHNIILNHLQANILHQVKSH